MQDCWHKRKNCKEWLPIKAKMKAVQKHLHIFLLSSSCLRPKCVSAFYFQFLFFVSEYKQSFCLPFSSKLECDLGWLSLFVSDTPALALRLSFPNSSCLPSVLEGGHLHLRMAARSWSPFSWQVSLAWISV